MAVEADGKLGIKLPQTCRYRPDFRSSGQSLQLLDPLGNCHPSVGAFVEHRGVFGGVEVVGGVSADLPKRQLLLRFVFVWFFLFRFARLESEGRQPVAALAPATLTVRSTVGS